MLKAYFDDSGRDEIAVGGCVASVDAWAEIESAWLTATSGKMEWFHAVDFERRAPGFGEHLSDGERSNLLSSLIAALRGKIRAYGGFLAAIATPDVVEGLEEFRLAGGGSNRARGERPSRIEHFTDQIVDMHTDPYCHCLGTAFGILLNHYTVPPGEVSHVFFANQPGKNGKITYVYAMAANHPPYARHLGGLSHGPEMNPRTIVPLQVADFAAYYLTLLRRRPDGARAWVGQALQPQKVEYASGLWLTEGWSRA
jgi:hypothetical protein